MRADSQRDRGALRADLSRDEASTQSWLEEWVYNVLSRTEYVDK